ncbi:MAG TPA: hypothetical protein VN814_10960 [Caulobacteraceae bacterium]|nr:hypothetical protein [Caulobacteraceae bacterium]
MAHSISGDTLRQAQRRIDAPSTEGGLRTQPSDHLLAMLIGAIAFAIALVLLTAPSAE